MKELINIPEKYKITTTKDRGGQLKDKIYNSIDKGLSDLVKNITWVASIKQGLGGVVPSRTQNIRYDELEIFYLTITDTQKLYQVCAPLYKAIKYPCLLVLQYKSRYILSVCKFSAGKLDYDENVNISMVFSHWIFPDNLSQAAVRFIEQINQIIANEGDLNNLYNALYNAVINFKIGGITKAHVNRLLDNMLDKKVSPSFWKNLTPYKKYDLAGTGKKAKYSQRGTSFHYRYDTEDLWHAFTLDEDLNRVLIGRRYRDIEDLLFTIDTILEDSEE